MTPPTVQFIPATGPSLIIHDQFTGSLQNLDGRTPDTVNNGNNWEASNLYYKVDSGILYYAQSAFGSWSGIDADTSTFRIEAVTQGVSGGGAYNFEHGIFFYTDSATGYWERVNLTKGTYNMTLAQVYYNGTYTNSVLDTFAHIADSTDIEWVIDCSPSSVSWSLTVSGSEVTSGSFSPYFTPNRPGWSGRRNNVNIFCSDFKVYA